MAVADTDVIVAAMRSPANGRADLLVTFNEPDYGTVPERFGIQAMTPRRAMERIGK